MKRINLLIICLFCFPFLGMDTLTVPIQESKPVKIRIMKIRPTMKQLIQLKESELQRANSDLKTEIATFE